MRLMLVSSRYRADAVGGAEAVVRQLALTGSSLGHDVAVLTAMSESSAASHVIELPGVRGSIEVFHVRPSPLYAMQTSSEYDLPQRLFAHFRDLSPRKGVADVEQALQTFQPDIIVTNNFRGLGASTLVAASRHKSRWIHVIHDMQLIVPSGLMMIRPEDKTVWERKPIAGPYRAWTRHLVRSVDKVIAPSRWILNAHLAHGFFDNTKTALVQYPPIPQTFTDTFDATLSKDVELNPHQRTLRVFLAGQLEYHKGILWAVSAMKAAPFPLDITVCGSTARASSESTVLTDAKTSHTRVRMEGKVPHHKVAQLMQQSDVVVVPSLAHESFSLVVAEAQALGIPIVASRSGGIIERVPAAMTFEAGSAEGLITCLQRVYEGNFLKSARTGTFSDPGQYFETVTGDATIQTS
jgi:glycosyltransferase involved in cell wall biosynthesis